MTLHVDVQFALDDVDPVCLPDAGQFSRWAQAALNAVDRPFSVAWQMTLRLVGETEIVRLNRDYRHKAVATNVLSFPFEAPLGLPASECGSELGDVVICMPVVQREAAQQGKTEENHWAHMVVHGTLHLLGYDHITDAEAVQMESLEIQILAGLGFANPYIESA
ncbi:MAG TPA: rRNA maturation RNase YbeY [Gammaproteobacteria bacterium]|nr:rRNA maturation RNase YbeY [Gammaproteobacteria bacterium]